MPRTATALTSLNTARSFSGWMALVNAEIEARAGVSANDIEDFPYSDYYEDGFEPEETAIEALENAGWSL